MAETTKACHEKVEAAVRNFRKKLRGRHTHLPSGEAVAELKKHFTPSTKEDIHHEEDALDDGDDCEKAAQNSQKELRRVFDRFDKYLEGIMSRTVSQANEQENEISFLRFLLGATLSVLRAEYRKQYGVNRHERHNPLLKTPYNDLLSTIRRDLRHFFANTGSSALLAQDSQVNQVIDAFEFGCRLLESQRGPSRNIANLIPFNNRTFLSLLRNHRYEGAEEYITKELTRELMERSGQANSQRLSKDSESISPVNLVAANLNYRLKYVM
ncbi:hypothetical protein MGU_11099 [Metarhizium guizhouense ARSEF 977]|uniref:Uncharacterized protein n=1 Tax=Metarhizium guizhouense (strain ARSEF 977) TaxID=1276136 RepID=A0A0B4GVQ5_METGA|nr:hypothetical protein MGU_11099 [Metarhizium guizhouense ARSEF 977]